MFAATVNNNVMLYDTTLFTNYTIQTYDDMDNNSASCLSFSPCGKQLAIGCGNDIKIWDIETETTLYTLPSDIHVLFLCFSPMEENDIQYLASIYFESSIIKIWNTLTGLELYTININSGIIQSICFNSYGSRLAAGILDMGIGEYSIRMWNMATRGRTPIFTLVECSDSILSLSFSPIDDRQLLASGSADSTIKIWNIESTTYNLLHILGHTGDIVSLSFSPLYGDNGKLASGSTDSTIKIWETINFTELYTLRNDYYNSEFLNVITFSDQILSLDFSSDGEQLIAGSQKGQLKIWNIGYTDALLYYNKTFNSPVFSVKFKQYECIDRWVLLK